MKGQWFWLSIAAVFLLLGVVGLKVWKYVGIGQTKTKGLPEELTSEFDPTVNEVIFVIEAVDPARKALQLRGVYPPGWENVRHESKITCQEEDIKIVDRSDKGLTGSAALFAVIEETPKQDLLFSGRCADLGCIVIDRDCRLSVVREEGSG